MNKCKYKNLVYSSDFQQYWESSYHNEDFNYDKCLSCDKNKSNEVTIDAGN